MAGDRLKEWLGRFALVGLGLFLIGAAELGLRLVGYGDSYNFVLSDSKLHEGKSSLNSQYVALHYFKHLPVNLSPLMSENPWFPDTEFSTEKKEDEFRIFLVGASTTRGFPFTSRQINYSRFLDLILKDVVPGKNIEVVNAGYDALSSFGVLDLTREIVKNSPDMLIIYTGHNEFIGHFGVNSNINYGDQRWVMDLVTNLHHSKLFLAGELMALKMLEGQKGEVSRKSQINLFRAMLSESKITWDFPDHSIALRHYRENLNRMVTLGKKHGANVMLLNPASNVRDFTPIRSTPDGRLSAREVKEMEDLVKTAQQSLNLKQIELAFENLKKALQMDSGYALSHFLLGRVYEEKGNYDRANKEYRLARELDRVHLRACAEMHEVVRQIGSEQEVTVIELERKMEKIAPNGMVGENFFLEHVHPNINGHFVIADSIAHALHQEPETGLDGYWDWTRLAKANTYVRRIGYDSRQFLEARYTVGRLLLDFPFYQCDSGQDILKRIKRQGHEKDLIEACWQNQSALSSPQIHS